MSNGSQGWEILRHLWSDIEQRNTPDYEPGRAFERLVLDAFELDGAQVRRPFTVRGVGPLPAGSVLEEIDGAVHTNGLWCLVQSKDTKEEVNVEPIAKLRNQLLRRPSQAVGLLFSTSGFTSSAKVLASFLAPQTILLWDANDIEFCLEHEQICEPLLRKYRVCVEEGRPDHSLPLEEPR